MRTTIPLSSRIALCTALVLHALPAQDTRPRTFGIWATSCAHIFTDRMRGRSSVETAIRQSEGQIPGVDGFDWDLWIDTGDLSGSNQMPLGHEGQDLIRQYQVMTKHRREQIYNLQGNHDASWSDSPGLWFQRWGDPFGEHTEVSGVDAARRPFPVEGTWERYRFVAGNVLVLMLSDRNDAPQPVGRGPSTERKSGGFPEGAVTRETFDWWKQQVLDNQDKIIITAHHHVLRDTTTGSDFGEGGPYHSTKNHAKSGASFLYYIIENEDPENFEFTPDARAFEGFLSEFHEAHGRGAIDLWIGGHTHVRNPDDTHGDKSTTEQRWGVHFVQVAALTQHHNGAIPMSRVLTLEDGAAELTSRVYCHVPYRDAGPGFYEPQTVTLPLRHPFEAPDPIRRMAPFPEVTKTYRRPTISESRRMIPYVYETEPCLDVSEGWDPSGDGRLDLARKVGDASATDVGHLPTVAADAPSVLTFDGTQRLRLAAADTDDWEGITVSFSARPKPQVDSFMQLIGRQRIGDTKGFRLLSRLGGWRWVLLTETRRTICQGGPLPQRPHEFVHVVATFECKTGFLTLYIDGELVSRGVSDARALPHVGGVMSIGGDASERTLAYPFVGELRDVRVWSRALTGAEVAGLGGG